MKFEFLINSISEFLRRVIFISVALLMLSLVAIVWKETARSLVAIHDEQFMLADRCSRSEKSLEILRKSSKNIEPKSVSQWYKILVLLLEKNHLDLHQWEIQRCHCQSEECFTPASLMLSGQFNFVTTYLQEISNIEGLIQKEIQIREDHRHLMVSLKLNFYRGSSCR